MSWEAVYFQCPQRWVKEFANLRQLGKRSVTEVELEPTTPGIPSSTTKLFKSPATRQKTRDRGGTRTHDAWHSELYH
uniref:Uncharacterized protein n=1 Tax=Acrobeloides nanus TaxID=290746 RepID=A0A914BYY8_9BILA